MAVATRSSSAALVKAAVLPLILVLLAVAAGASNTEDGPAVAEAGGRFPGTPQGRKLLALLNGCNRAPLYPSGSPNDYSCPYVFPSPKVGRCCPGPLKLGLCVDLNSDLANCGSCDNKCPLGQVCCKGVCANLLTDKNNCLFCGNVCRGGRCTLGFCNY